MEGLSGISDAPLWLILWKQKLSHVVAFSFFLIVIILSMVFKDRLARKKTALNIFSYLILVVSFAYVGFILKAQPTSTNIVIALNSLRDLQFPLRLFLMEPFIFLSFVFIFITIILWGRSVFCGWLCPYGAMVELLNRIYQKMTRFRIILPEKVHEKMVYIKYFIFFIIVGVSFYNFILSEYLTEVEPFRTFVLKLNREWYFILYFVIITFSSIVMYRAFCRYLCPLGGALALPSLFKKMHLIKLKRHDLCGSCKICGKACPYQAITPDGVIDISQCFYCLDCQINFWDEDICPVLIKKRKKKDASGIARVS